MWNEHPAPAQPGFHGGPGAQLAQGSSRVGTETLPGHPSSWDRAEPELSQSRGCSFLIPSLSRCPRAFPRASLIQPGPGTWKRCLFIFCCHR